MTAEEFCQYWERPNPDCLPVGYRLRKAYASRWFRIHSLPASRRYAESEGEYQEILHRHNTVLSDIFGNDQPFVLVSTGYSEAQTPVQMWPEVAAHYPRSRHFLSVHLDDDFVSGYWHFFMHDLVWTPDLVDTVLRQVADEESSNILVVNVERDSVFAPYDGGDDIILLSVRDRAAMRERYIDWLPANALGL